MFNQLLGVCTPLESELLSGSMFFIQFRPDCEKPGWPGLQNTTGGLPLPLDN